MESERRNEKMKQTIKMSRAVGQLEKMFNSINQDFFDGTLPVPIITIQSKPGTWGHMSRANVNILCGDCIVKMIKEEK